jgi:uncharacterized protein YbjT (DUF2867 family)
MKIFVTGATGYIGGTLAQRLVQAGHQVHGLVRSPETANLLAQAGIVPVLGTAFAPRMPAGCSSGL